MGLLSNGVGLYSGERVFESTPAPLSEQPLKFIAHGHIFESLRYLWMDTAVYLYLTVQQHILISPSLAVAVGILTIPFVLLPSNCKSSLFTIFQPFMTHSPALFSVKESNSDMPLQIPGMYRS